MYILIRSLLVVNQSKQRTTLAEVQETRQIAPEVNVASKQVETIRYRPEWLGRLISIDSLH